MRVRYGVCESVVRQGSLAADAALTAAAGIGALGVTREEAEAVGIAEAARILADAGLVASSYIGFDRALVPASPAEVRTEAERVLDATAALGAPGALVGSGPLDGRTVAEADAQVRAWLEIVAPVAAERGVRVMLEPMHPLMRQWTFVHTFEHALSLVEGLPGAGVVVDVGHLWWQRDLPALVAANVEAVATVQITDVDGDALGELRYARAQLGEGDLGLAGLVTAIEEAGYRGTYENEVLARVPRERRLDVLRDSAAWFASVLS